MTDFPGGQPSGKPGDGTQKRAGLHDCETHREPSAAFSQEPRSAAAPQRKPSPDRICEIVAATFAVPCGELRAATVRGCRQVSAARQCAMYLAHVLAGLSFSEVGRAFGRDRTTAAYACRRVEELRDNPLVDSLVEEIEERCNASASGVEAAS